MNVKPYPAYHYIYPFESNVLSNLAYYFTYEYANPQDVQSYTASLADQIAVWENVYDSSDLFSVDVGSELLIWDLRPQSIQSLTVLNSFQKTLYLSCDRVCTQNELELLINTFEDPPTQNVEELLQPLLEQRLMLKDGNSYLSLAIPLGDYSPSASVIQKFKHLLTRLGKESNVGLIITTEKESTALFSQCVH